MTHAEFGRLFAHYRPRFIAIAQSYVRDAVVAEDLVTDSFLSFWEHRTRIELDSTPAAYILAALRNKCLNYLRDRQNHLRTQRQLHSAETRIVQSRIDSLEMCDPKQLFADELLALVRTELERMPELTRLVFIASRLRQKTYREIADEQGITVRRVTSEIQTALERLRLCLKDYLPAWIIPLLIAEYIHKIFQ